MKQMGKRIFAAVLAAALLFTLPGMTAYGAAGGQGEPASQSATAGQVETEEAAPEAGDGGAEKAGAGAPEAGDGGAEKAGTAAPEAGDGGAEKAGT
ncbi:MAG: hypothetical protein HDT27_03670, partial [Subdoligranulum sp.]|nr:hypothetical protein [Subdoligranulum sp.]